jgi:hypothetical protein
MTDDYRSCLDELRRRDLLPADHHAVFVAGSLVRGWGNVSSDFDIYVVCAEAPTGTPAVANVGLRPDVVPVEVAYVNRQRWDIEYWTDGQVDQLLDKVSWHEFDTNQTAGDRLNRHEMDFLERLGYAVPVAGEDWLQRRRKQLDDSALRSVLVARALNFADLFVEDAVGQLKSDDVESAVLSARLAFGNAVDALLASGGQFGQSGKWRARRFRQVEQDVMSWDEYWTVETMRDYDPADPARWVESVVLMCRKISLEVSI